MSWRVGLVVCVGGEKDVVVDGVGDYSHCDLHTLVGISSLIHCVRIRLCPCLR